MGGMRRTTLVLMIGALAAVACTAGSAAPPLPPSPSPGAVGSGGSTAPRFTSAPLSGEVLAHTRSRNWQPGCPVALSDLRELTVTYHTFDGTVKTGPLVVNASVADDVLSVFRRLFRAGFEIKHIALAGKWHAHRRPGEYASTKSTTAAFNCRPVTHGTTLSQHSYGWAIDINPVQNPYIGSNGKMLQRAAKAYVDRSQQLPGMIHPGDLVVRSFAKIGWGWGGDWHSMKDYMHFSLTGT
jgi:hypothetical protein